MKQRNGRAFRCEPSLFPSSEPPWGNRRGMERFSSEAILPLAQLTSALIRCNCWKPNWDLENLWKISNFCLIVCQAITYPLPPGWGIKSIFWFSLPRHLPGIFCPAHGLEMEQRLRLPSSNQAQQSAALRLFSISEKRGGAKPWLIRSWRCVICLTFPVTLFSNRFDANVP